MPDPRASAAGPPAGGPGGGRAPGRSRERGVSVGIAVTAAFAWSTYYLFVLWATPGAAPSAILVVPFAFGGLAYTIWAVARGEGRAFLRIWASAEAYLRTAILAGMQAAMLAATYLTGPVDASLLSLLGDVVATPLIAAAVFAGPRASLTSPAFGVGLALSLAGGTLAIVEGQRLAGIHGLAWLPVVAVPVGIGFYFVLSARAAGDAPSSAVVGQTFVGAAVVTAVFAPLFPGGTAGLWAVSGRPLAELVTNGLVSFFAAPVLYFLAIRREGLVLPPTLMTGIPIFTLLLAAGVLRERIPLLALAGIPVAVVGALFVLRAVATVPETAASARAPGA